MTGVVGVHLAETCAEPSLGQRDGVACCTGVEDFFAFGGEMAEGEEEVYV